MLLEVRLALAACALAGLACLPAGVRADDADLPSLLTDRPRFTETSLVVPPRSVQLEGGLTFAGAGAISEYNVPQLLTRAGLTRRAELRVELPDYVRIDAGSETDHRLGEGSFGAKFQLGPTGAPWGAALIPAITIPFDRYEKARPAPELILAWSRALPRDWSAGGRVGHAWLRSVDRGPNTVAPAVSFARTMGERVGVFFEWAAEFADGVPASHLVHLGYTYAVAHDLQLDVHGGAGLSGEAPDFFLGAGFAWRPIPRP